MGTIISAIVILVTSTVVVITTNGSINTKTEEVQKDNESSDDEMSSDDESSSEEESSDAIEEEFEIFDATLKKDCNLRANAEWSKKIGFIHKDDEIKIVEAEDPWWELDEYEGFIHENCLEEE